MLKLHSAYHPCAYRCKCKSVFPPLRNISVKFLFKIVGCSKNNDYLCNQELYIDLTFTERLYLMNNTDVIKSLLEFAHGVTQAPELAQLLNVLYKSNTHSPQHISARSVDSAIECMENCGILVYHAPTYIVTRNKENLMKNILQCWLNS